VLMGAMNMTIYGSKFDPVLANNKVTFTGVFGDKTILLEATPAQVLTDRLVLLAPNFVQDTNIVSTVRIRKTGTQLFSNSKTYDMLPAVKKVGYLNTALSEQAVCLTSDTSGAIYFSVIINALSGGIAKLDANGVRTQYAPIATGVLRWLGMKMGPGGLLYAVRQPAPFVMTIAQGQQPGTWANTGNGIPSSARFADLDFDQSGNLWVVGFNTSTDNTIFMITPAKVTTPYAFRGTFKSVRAIGSDLYFGGTRFTATDTLEGVWKASITGGVMGTPSLYFDMKAAYGSTAKVNVITFASDGAMFVGTNHSAGIIKVQPNAAGHAPIYPGLIFPETVSMAWGKASGPMLYFGRVPPTGSTLTPQLYQMNTLQSGAVYHGAQ